MMLVRWSWVHCDGVLWVQEESAKKKKKKGAKAKESVQDVKGASVIKVDPVHDKGQIAGKVQSAALSSSTSSSAAAAAAAAVSLPSSKGSAAIKERSVSPSNCDR
jgi:hypothetical protein